ncbi:hypothetical protein V6N13_059947 [Hibiscus sabdariffa]
MTLHRPIDLHPEDNFLTPMEVLSHENFHGPMEVVPPGTHCTDRLVLFLMIHFIDMLSYVTKGHPLSLKSENASTLDRKTLQQEVVFKILCLNERVGGVIGKGGATIKALQNDSGETVAIGTTFTNCDERLVTVTASENPKSQYSPAQKVVVLVFVRAYEASIEKCLDSGLGKGSNVIARLVIPLSQVGYLLGKGGATIYEMCKVIGTNIWILGTDQVPKCVSENDQVDTVWKVLHAGGIFVCLNSGSSDYDYLHIMNGDLSTKEFKKALGVGADVSMNGQPMLLFDPEIDKCDFTAKKLGKLKSYLQELQNEKILELHKIHNHISRIQMLLLMETPNVGT